MARRYLGVDGVKGNYGIEDFELYNAVQKNKLPAYLKESLEIPLSPSQVVWHEDIVDELNRMALMIWAKRCESKEDQHESDILPPGLYHIKDCCFLEQDIKKCFKSRIPGLSERKKGPFTLPELMEDSRVRGAMFAAGEMLKWAMDPDTPKPITKETFLNKFDRIKKMAAKQGPVIKGTDKDVARVIWEMWAEYHPELRTKKEGGRNVAGRGCK